MDKKTFMQGNLMSDKEQLHKDKGKIGKQLLGVMSMVSLKACCKGK